ncbi:hypothetical protein ACQP60_06010 [Isoptericola variabilis]|uniref:hypothetical protein n=1 Tax=Isoptericola variabilis TaxID=139208 RepID=UPI003D1F06B9
MRGTGEAGWPHGVLLLRPARSAITARDVHAAETALGWAFPPGYEAYVTSLGEGSYCDLVRITAPGTIADSTAWGGASTSRAEWSRHWAWDGAVLTPADVPHLVPLGDTYDGDQIVAHRDGGVFVLPRHDDVVLRCGATLRGALDALTGGATPSFCPWGEASSYENFLPEADGVGWSYERARDAVAALGLHAAVDLDDHGARFLVPAIGGHVTLVPSGYAHVACLASREAEAGAFKEALVAAGLTRRSAWGDGAG